AARSHSICISGDSAIYVFGGRKYTNGHAYVREYRGSNRIDIFKNGIWNYDTTIIQGHIWGGRGLKVGSKIMFTGFVDS
ncbi:hypothetical protein NL529_34085, partial [Klebsiella pneumoniae]|nr:hypothetical protein [Klebsiella pneumoniae]